MWRQDWLMNGRWRQKSTMQPTVDRFPAVVWWCATTKQTMIFPTDGDKAADKSHAEERKMILADKIMNLRKKNGWSQEELAEKMQVSRQAVSKWEGAQSVPDLERILMLSKLFGVTTDYLLKDEIEDEEFTDDADHVPVKQISLAQANEFLEWRKRAACCIAAATFLCIVAVVPLLLLSVVPELPGSPVSENLAGGVGLATLLIIVAFAVAVFIFCGFKNAPFEFIDKEPFETEYGVDGMVKEKQKAYRPTYVKFNIIAACLCVLSPVPLLIGSFTENEFFTVVMLTVTILLAGIGTVLFIMAGVRWASMQKLLREGDYALRDLRDQKKLRIKKSVRTIYWLSANAIYLGWSFLTEDWEITWVVWPIAGILFGVVMCICNLIIDRDKE